MRLTLTSLLAAATVTFAGSAGAIVAFPDSVAFGETEVLTQSFTDAYADQATFTTEADGNVLVQVYGLTDSLATAAAVYEDTSAFAFGNIVNDAGSVGSFTLAGLTAGTYTLDLIGTTFPATLKGTFGVNVTLTPIPAGALLLGSAVGGLGLLASRRGRARTQ